MTIYKRFAAHLQKHLSIIWKLNDSQQKVVKNTEHCKSTYLIKNTEYCKSTYLSEPLDESGHEDYDWTVLHDESQNHEARPTDQNGATKQPEQSLKHD